MRNSLVDLDFKGLIIDSWEVLYRKASGPYVWICRCVKCNIEIGKNYIALHSGIVSPCSNCKKQALIKPNIGIDDARAIAHVKLFEGYQKRAGERHLDFTIKYNIFVDMIQKSCHYCNSTPIEGIARFKQFGYEFAYNGIDRVNNNIGYLTDNVVACCSICNRAKLTGDVKDFLAWIARIRR